MPPDMLLDFVAVQVNGPRAAQSPQRLLLTLIDRDATYLLEIRNGVLVATPTSKAPEGTPSVEITQRALGQLVLGDTKPGDVQDVAHGDLSALVRLLSLLDPPRFWFGLAVPS